MQTFPIESTPEMLALASRVVWFKSNESALRDPMHFVAHVLTYGRHDDVKQLRRLVSDEQLRAAIEHAPAGVFDERTWNYWRLILDMPPATMPRRVL